MNSSFSMLYSCHVDGQLYDLMSMGFKYQLLSTVQASDLLQISLNHLDALGEIARDTPCAALVDRARALLLEVWENHTIIHFFGLFYF